MKAIDGRLISVQVSEIGIESSGTALPATHHCSEQAAAMNYKKPACSSSIWLDSKLFQYIIRRIDPTSELRDHWLPDFEEKSSMKFLSNNLRFILLYVEIILDMAK